MTDDYIDVLLSSSTYILNAIRVYINDSCSALEPWQLMSYSMSFVFLTTWAARLLRSQQIFSRAYMYGTIGSLPWVKRRLKTDLQKARLSILDDVHESDKFCDFFKFLPEHPIASGELILQAKRYQGMNERRGDVANVQLTADDSEAFLKIFETFAYDESFSGQPSHGLRKMEAEVVRMCRSLFHGGTETTGVLCTDRHEALLLACLAYRNRHLRSGSLVPEIIAPASADPCLEKAAAIFGIRIIRTAVTEEDFADIDAIRRAINSETCLIIASAPNRLSGTMDPIEKISELALENNIPLHVECSLGGFLLPFMEYCDFSCPTFDFRLPGVHSISTDFHSFGLCPVPCSALLYRDGSMLRHQAYSNVSWPATVPTTATLCMPRGYSTTAAMVWSSMLRMGRDGYVNCCRQIVEGTRSIADLLEAIEGVELFGDADLCVVAFTTKTVDIYEVINRLNNKGWQVEPILTPAAARLSISLMMSSETAGRSFVSDLEGILKALADKGQSAKSSKFASYQRMLRTVSDRNLIEELSFMRLQAQYSTPPVDSQLRGRLYSNATVRNRKYSFMSTTTTAE